MCIALIGGMDRLGKHYQEVAEKNGIDLRVFNTSQINIGAKLKNVDAVVIFTNMVSHQFKKEAMHSARANGIPVYMHHSCGVCTLKDCFACIRKVAKEPADV